METSLEILEKSIRRMIEDLRMTKEKNGYDFVSLLNLMEIVNEISKLKEKEERDLNDAFEFGKRSREEQEKIINYYSQIFKEKKDGRESNL
jgi:fibronectin type 3 domain-containing protein